MKKLHNDGAPQISFTNWILGGPLIKKSGGRKRSLSITAVSGNRKSSPVVEEEKKNDEVVVVKEVEKTDGKNVAAVEEKKDAEKKDGDVEKEGEKKDETKPVSKGPLKSSRTWTDEEDKLLLSMKEAGKPIKDICPLVKASKKEINTRIKELQDAKGETPANDADAKKATVEDGGDDNTSNTELPLAGLFDSDPDSGSKKDKSKDAGDKSKQNPSKEKPSHKSTAAEPVAASVSTSEQSQSGRLKADHIWSAADCEMLEWLEKTYTEQKWLQLQSAFYNRTGRMVQADVIKLKFES